MRRIHENPFPIDDTTVEGGVKMKTLRVVLAFLLTVLVGGALAEDAPKVKVDYKKLIIQEELYIRGALYQIKKLDDGKAEEEARGHHMNAQQAADWQASRDRWVKDWEMHTAILAKLWKDFAANDPDGCAKFIKEREAAAEKKRKQEEAKKKREEEKAAQ
jgi:hypothetical protein